MSHERGEHPLVSSTDSKEHPVDRSEPAVGHIRPAVLFLTVALCLIAGFPASALASPPTATTEAATAVSYEEATLKGSVNPEGSATSYWFEYGETTSYGTKIPASPKSIGSGTSKVLVSNLVTGLKESTTYHFRVVAEGGGETVPGEDATFKTAGFDLSFAEKGSGNGQLSEPFDLALDSKGNVWISDTGNNRIEEFGEKGEYIAQFGKTGSGKGEFKTPKGIAIDSSGNIWVVDSGNDRVQKLNSKGEWICSFGKEGSGEAELKSPTGIALDSSSRPFIADTGNSRIQKLNSKCEHLATFGKEGSGNGELKAPEGVLIDAKGRVWVVDTGNNRVQRFNPSTFAFISKFGEEGGGNSQFKAPVGITYDFQEKLWITDSGNDRAQKFNTEGEYLDKVGEEGTGPGQLAKPTAVAGAGPQKILILDSGNNRVEAWTIKAERPTATTSTAIALKATAATVRGTINPLGLSTTYWFEYGETTSYGTKIPITPESVGSGLSNVSVEQTITGLKENTKYHFRIVAESASGASTGIDRTFTTLKLPKVITESATSVKATQATLNAKVNPESHATSYWFEYGETIFYGTKIPISPGSAGSETFYLPVKQTPTGLKKGTEYHFRVVAESEAGTVQGVDKAFVTTPPQVVTEPASEIELTQAALNAKVNPEGHATSYWFEYGETASFGSKIPVSPESVGSGTSDVVVEKTLTGLKKNTEYHFRVVAENENGISTGIERVFTTGPYRSLSFGSLGSGNGEFLTPRDIATDPEGNIWVVDEEESRIQKFSKEGKYIAQFGKEGSSDGQLYEPKSLAIDTEGNIWVADSNNSRIEEFDEEGSYLFKFGKGGSEPGQFGAFSPSSIEIDAKGNIWAADAPNGRLQEFDQEGNLIQVVGSPGSKPGQLEQPGGIDIGPGGNVWVADSGNDRVVEFDEAGELVREFGERGTGIGQFKSPGAIEIDEAGNVWIVDTINYRVQWFDEEGKYVGKFTIVGPGEEGGPSGITSDAEGSLWISNWENCLVEKWVPLP